MSPDSPFHTTLTGFLNGLTARTVSQHTRIAYQTDLTQFFTWLLENDVTVSTPLQVSKGHIIDYLAFLAHQGRSGVTRARKLAAIREYFKYLVVEKQLPASPASTIALSKKERKRRVSLRVDEYRKLLHAAASHSRDYAMLQLFLQTGIRITELVGLTLSDLDLDQGKMLIHGKGSKQHTISLEKKASQALESYLAVRPPGADQHVFLTYQGTGFSVRGVMDIVEKYAKAAGISKQFSCRSLRHTCAMYKAKKGYLPRDLQQLLGHEKPETSFIYVHVANDPKKLMQQTSL